MGWSRAELGRRLGSRTDKTIALYESEASDELLSELAALAAAEGQQDFQRIFLDLAGDAHVSIDPDDPKSYAPRTAEEVALVRTVLDVLRDPDPKSRVQAGLPELIRQIQNHRDEFYRPGGSSVA